MICSTRYKDPHASTCLRRKCSLLGTYCNHDSNCRRFGPMSDFNAYRGTGGFTLGDLLSGMTHDRPPAFKKDRPERLPEFLSCPLMSFPKAEVHARRPLLSTLSTYIVVGDHDIYKEIPRHGIFKWPRFRRLAVSPSRLSSPFMYTVSTLLNFGTC